MLAPKRVKWRKQQKGKMRGVALRGGSLFFGQFGLQATECGRINARQLEAARVAMTRYIKRGGKIWIRIFPDKPITKKAAETRMGSGKGNVEDWAAVIRPGRVIFEIDEVPQAEAFEALRLASHKLPVHCKNISKRSEAIMKKIHDDAKAIKKAKKLAAEKSATEREAAHG